MFVVTDGVWQSAFVVTDAGVIVFDAPETYAAKIRAEITAVTRQPITTLVYTHIHKDHIGGSAAFKDIKGLEIVALTGVAEFLAEKNDPARLKPTRTFDDQLVLTPRRNAHRASGRALPFGRGRPSSSTSRGRAF